MKIMPIIFSESMVRAILDGRKTMTRRVIKPQPCPEADRFVKFGAFSDSDFAARFGNESANAICDRKPKYRPGDILWVRETWTPFGGTYLYKANGGGAGGGSWRSSMYMPRAASRLFLRVATVRVERAQEITEADAKAEGIRSYWSEPHRDDAPFIGAAKELGADLCSTRAEAFSQLWNHLNAKHGYGRSTNPWVWAYTFERIEKPERWCQ